MVRGEFKEIAGVKRIVSKELKQFTVKLIGAGAGGDVDDRARAFAVLRAEG